MTKNLFKVLLLLPLTFGARTSKEPPFKKPKLSPPPSADNTNTTVLTTTGPAPSEPANYKVDEAREVDPFCDFEFEKMAAKIGNSVSPFSTLVPFEKTENQKLFAQLKEVCTDGLYHKIPLDPEFVKENDPANYLALAIEARDKEAIFFSKDFVEIYYSTPYLQKALMDLIFQENVDFLDVLGHTFPGIYTSIFAFYEPYTAFSGSYLVRIAVDRKLSKAAMAMFRFVPVSVIGDFWSNIKSMKGPLLAAMQDRSIRLRPLEGESGIDRGTLIDMLYTCVETGNSRALEYFIESTDFPLDISFVDEHGINFSPMYLAAHFGYPEMVKYLGEKCPELFTKPTSTGMLPIHVAAGSGHMDVIKIIEGKARDTLMAEVDIDGVKLTPFAVAIRNKKRNVADVILAFLDDKDAIQREMGGLAAWGIQDDNQELLRIAFEYDHSTHEHLINNGRYTLLELAVLGSIDPENVVNDRSSINCLEFLAEVWLRKDLSFEVTHGKVRGSILGLLPPNDIAAFLVLVKIGRVDPNDPIFEYSDVDGSTPFENTFLNRIIAKGATQLVEVAIKFGADPRICDEDGNDAMDIAVKYGNQHVIDFLKM